MRFSDFLLVSNPTDLDFIVGYTDDQNIRINVLDLFAGQIIGGGTAGYIPVFTAANVINDSVLFQDGSNLVIGGEDSLGYTLAIGGSLLALDGAVIESSTPGSDTFRTVGEEGDSFIIPNDSDESVWTSRRIMHAPAVLTTESATLGQLNAAISTLEGDIDILLDLKVDKSSVGEPNGVASLDATGKIPLSEIPDSIIGQVEYMGTWNAFTNTPTLNPLVPEQKGHYYVVSAAGVFGGVDYQIGDWIISNGVEWQKVDNTDAVTSVFGRIGAILALEGDYQAFYPRLSQAYDNPSFINSLAYSKITGVPPFLLENQTITLSGDVTGTGKTSITSTISNNVVSNEKLRDSLGTSVIGRAASSTGDPGDIQASTDGHVLQRSGGTLLFGLISSDSIGSIDWSKIINTPTTLSGYGITDAYTKTEADNKFVPYTGANANVNLGSNNITSDSFVKSGGTSSQFLKADGSVDVSQYVPTTRSVNAGTGLTGGGNLSSDVTISFDTTWGDTRYAYRTRQLTINGLTFDLSADRTWNVGTVTSVGLSMPSAFTVSNSPVTGTGTLTVVGAGTTAQYIRGDGSLATFPSLTGYVPYTGATQNVDLGEFGVDAGFVNLDTTPTNTPTTQGTIYWDDARSTAALIMNGTIQHIGQDTFFYVKNSTGSSIPKGTAVRFAGTDGASGHLLITPFLANGSVPSTYFMGVTAETIGNGQFGQVMHFGELEGIDTSGFTAGDLLYASTTVAGGFQTTAPVAPNNIVLIAAAINSKNNGAILVRPTYGSNINTDEGVKITSPATGQLLQLQAGGLWENKTIAQVLGGTSSQFVKGDGSLDSNVYALNSALANYQLLSAKGQPNGYAGLDSNGKVPLAQINDALIGNVNFQGLWNAATNTPTLANPPAAGTKGYYYIVSTGGTFAGISFEVGDWIISNGSAWGKVDNTDAVSSVFGRTGNVTAANGDYNTSQVTESTNLYFTNARAIGSVLTGYTSGAGTISAADTILSAIQKLNGNIGGLTTGVSSVFGRTGAVVAANGDYYLGTTAIQAASANQAITGITGITFVAHVNDAASITTTISSTSTFFDFNLADDNVNDEWRWRFTPSGAGVYNAMRLVPTTNTTSNLIVSGNIIKSGGTSSQFLKADGSVDSNTYLTGNQTITLSGVVTGSGATAITTAIANGAITNAMLANSSFFVGTTSIALGRASAAQTLNGVSISGNAGTATILQTARTINGTSFDGSANITTDNWGTGRAITIGNTFKIVNGSGNVAWTLAEIGAAPSVAGGYLPLSGGTLTGALNGTTAVFSNTITGFRGTFTDGNQGLIVGYYTGGNGFGAIYPSTVTPNNSNYSFLAKSDSTILHAATGGSVSLSINNIAALTVDSSRNVLIGTNTSPSPVAGVSFPLVVSSNATTRIQINSTQATPNAGVGLYANGVQKFSFAMFGATSDFTIYNDALLQSALLIKGNDNAITANGTLSIKASATGSTTTQVPVFISNPASTSRELVTRTPAQFRSDIGAQAALTNPVTGTGAAGQVAFWNGTTTQTGDNGLFWDNTNKRLGIGTDAPATKLHISGAGAQVLRIENTNTAIVLNNIIGSIVFQSNDASVGGTGQAGSINSISEAASGVNYGLGFNTKTFATEVERMRITAEGNVGIGTTTFAYSPRLAVASVGPNSIAIQTTDTVQGSAGTVLYIGTGTSTGSSTYGQIAPLGNGGTSAANLVLQPTSSNGNVLIGTTTSNGARLQVSGASGNITGVGVNYVNNTEDAFALVINNAGTSAQNDRGVFDARVATNSVFRINNSGNVGIGTDVPATALDVKSFVQIDTYAAGTTVPNTSGFLRILSGSKTGWAPNDELGKIEFFGTDGSGIGARNLASIRAVNSQGNGTTTTTSNGELAFYTSATNALESEKVRINSAGLVGIGTPTPVTNLEVYARDASLRISDVKSASAIGEVSSSLQFWASDPSVASGSNASRTRASINTVFDTVSGSINSLVFNVNDGTPTGLPERMRINSAGILGLGVIPTAWGTVMRAIQLGNGASIFNWSGGNLGNVNIGSNNYDDGASAQRYINSSVGASIYGQFNGEHQWRIAPSGTAGAAISFTQAMTLFATGNLLVGTPSPISDNGSRLQVSGAATFSSSLTATNGIFSLTTTGGAIGSVRNLTLANTSGTLNDFAGINFAYYNNTTNFAYIGSIISNVSSNSAADLVFGVKASNAATSVSEYMRIKFGGNVGIGTTTPSGTLEVRTGVSGLEDALNGIRVSTIATGTDALNARGAGITFAQRYATSSIDNLVVRVGGIFGVKTNATSSFGGGLAFYTQPNSLAAMSERMRIDSSGNVGIGTPSPNTKLEMVDSGNAIMTVRQSLGAANGRYAQLILSHGTTFFGASDKTYQLVSNGLSSGEADFAIQYWNGSTYAERMRITSAGNVGIGTATPDSYTGTASTRVLAVGSTTGNNGVNVISGTTSTGSYMFSDSGGNDRGGLIYFHTADLMTLTTAGSERMRITSGGNVGIGDTNPNVSKLSVQSTDNTQPTVRISNHPDGGNNFVFQRWAYIRSTDAYRLDLVQDVSSGLVKYRFDLTNNSTTYTSNLVLDRGSVLIGTTAANGNTLRVNGTGWFDGNISSTGDVIAFASSDRRLKDNITTIENPLEKISKIGGYSFTWNSNQDTYSGKDYGVVAQEIEAILPELVRNRDTGYKAVKYEKLIPLLIESIKELNKKVELLELK